MGTTALAWCVKGVLDLGRQRSEFAICSVDSRYPVHHLQNDGRPQSGGGESTGKRQDISVFVGARRYPGTRCHVFDLLRNRYRMAQLSNR